MSINYNSKVNERITGSSISNESHIVGITGITTYSPGNIRLVEVPQAPSPLSTVSIPGYNEIFSGTPTGTQFIVDYTTGVITFATSQDGNTVLVSYIGLGSEFAAEDVNELQNPLGTIATLQITYNWPSAPTVSWILANNIVKPASISNTGTDDFTFPRNVTVSGLTSTGIVHNSSGGLLSTSLVMSADIASGQVVKSIHADANTNLFDNVQLVSGTNITLTQVGQAITISAPGGAFTPANLTDAGTDGITITGGTNAVNGSGTSISQHVADTTHNGYLSSTDWNTFNGKFDTAGTGLTSSGTTVSLVVPVVVADGGTGQTSLTAHDVLVGNGTSAITLISPSTTGFVFTSNGTGADPAFRPSGIGNVVSESGTGTVTPDASTANTFDFPVSGTLTIDGPTNGVDGQKVTLRIDNDATHTVTLATGAGNFKFGTDLPSYTNSTSTIDYIGVVWNSTAGLWHVVSIVRGF